MWSIPWEVYGVSCTVTYVRLEVHECTSPLSLKTTHVLGIAWISISSSWDVKNPAVKPAVDEDFKQDQTHERRKSYLRRDQRGARLCCKETNAALDCAAGWRYYTCASGDISLIQVKSKSLFLRECSKGQLIVLSSVSSSPHGNPLPVCRPLP